MVIDEYGSNNMVHYFCIKQCSIAFISGRAYRKYCDMAIHKGLQLGAFPIHLAYSDFAILTAHNCKTEKGRFPHIPTIKFIERGRFSKI